MVATTKWTHNLRLSNGKDPFGTTDENEPELPPGFQNLGIPPIPLGNWFQLLIGWTNHNFLSVCVIQTDGWDIEVDISLLITLFGVRLAAFNEGFQFSLVSVWVVFFGVVLFYYILNR